MVEYTPWLNGYPTLADIAGTDTLVVTHRATYEGRHFAVTQRFASELLLGMVSLDTVWEDERKRAQRQIDRTAHLHSTMQAVPYPAPPEPALDLRSQWRTEIERG